MLFSLMFAICLGVVRTVTTVPAWNNVIAGSRIDEVVRSYTNNVIRCEWAGSDVNVARLMPANVSCQFAVVGDADVTNRVCKVLETVVASINPNLRKGLVKSGLLNPTLQWMVRNTRAPKVAYLTAGAHPAAFVETDFNRARLVELANRLDAFHLPGVTTIRLVNDESEFAPYLRAVPEVDYPDIMPEEVFATPFGIGMVLRAPERIRKFRFKASVYGMSDQRIRYSWVVPSCALMKSLDADNNLRPETGNAEILLNTRGLTERLDIMVFAQTPNGVFGVPAIFSIYLVPFTHRIYDSRGRLDSIQYVLYDKRALYDLSPIWVPHQWTDYYELDSKENILSFNRMMPKQLKTIDFTKWGEVIKESYSSAGAPKVTRKVRYFISEDSGLLDFEEIGDEIHYKLGETRTTRRGW